MAIVIKTYKVELDPANKQRTAMLKHAGCARFAYNWGLDYCNKVYEEAKANGTKSKLPSDIDLHKALVKLKDSSFPWMRELSKCAPQCALQDLNKAFINFFRKKSKYPKFKSRHKAKLSFKLMSPNAWKLTSKSIKLPVIGLVRLKEHNYIPITARITQATVSERAGKWYVCVKVEVELEPITTTSDTIGIDLGIKTLATCSDGTTYSNAKYLKQSMKKLKTLSKQLSKHKKGSNRRKKTKAKLARVHARITDQRNDAIHKMTTDIARTKRPSIVVIEDLSVKNMMTNHKLAGAIADASFGEIRRQLEYKCKWYGIELVVADQYYPSTKTCSCCGAIKKMELGDRVYECLCGNKMDRDLNAAINLKQYNVSSGSSSEYARGEAQLASMKREPDTRSYCTI